MTDPKSVHTIVDKQEREMIQIELYTKNLDQYAELFVSVFHFKPIEEKPCWRQLRHPTYFDIMLFSPPPKKPEQSEFLLPEPGEGGKGIEIVICVKELANLKDAVADRGFECSEICHPSWGGVEFFFKLEEGYLFRVKQPPTLAK